MKKYKTAEEEILHSIGAYWKIDKQDVGRELFVVPADKKQVLFTIETIIKKWNKQNMDKLYVDLQHVSHHTVAEELWRLTPVK